MCDESTTEILACLDNKQRRKLISHEINKLGNYLPFSVAKSSQIRKLQAVCSYIRKEKHFEGLKSLKYEKDSKESLHEANFNELFTKFFHLDILFIIPNYYSLILNYSEYFDFPKQNYSKLNFLQYCYFCNHL